MCAAVIVGIGHDNDFMVVGIFGIEAAAYTCVKSMNDGVELFVFLYLFQRGMLGIEHFASKRQNGLIFRVPCPAWPNRRRNRLRPDTVPCVLLSLDWACTSFPEIICSERFFPFPLRAFSRASRAALRAAPALIILRMSVAAVSVFSSRK